MDRFPLPLQLCGTIQTMIQGSLFEPPARQTTVRVGPAGWHYKDWEGTVYPSGKGRSFDALAFIADYFDTVEINSSFYRPPRPEDAASWARRVRSGALLPVLEGKPCGLLQRGPAGHWKLDPSRIAGDLARGIFPAARAQLQKLVQRRSRTRRPV